MREVKITLPNGKHDVRIEGKTKFEHVVIGGIHRLTHLQRKFAEAEKHLRYAEQYAADADAIRSGSFTADVIEKQYGGSLVAFCEAVCERTPSLRGSTGAAAIEGTATDYDVLAAYHRREHARQYEAALAYDASGTDWYVISCHGTSDAASRSARRAQKNGRGPVAYDVIEVRPIDEMLWVAR